MVKKKVRLEEGEANRLNGILKDEIVITADHAECRVTQITKGGIQALDTKRRKIHAYPIYESFINGSVRFKDKACQEEMLHSLYEAARSVGVQTPPEKEQAARESDKPVVSQVDVPGNIRLALFFKNVDEDRYVFHMRHVGLFGFEESLDEGVRQNPFLSLRETEYYLGCSLELLLSSFEEYLQRMLGECTTSAGWSWSEPVRDRTTEGNPHLRAWCKNRDDRRSFVVHAAYADETLRNCKVMQVNVLDKRRDSFELHTMQFGVLDPKPETVHAFEEAYKDAGGTIARAPVTPAMVSEPPVASVTQKLSKNARRRAERYGKAPSGTEPTTTPPTGKVARKQAKPIRVNEFLVRRSYGSHRTNGHSLEPIRATVTILPKAGGDPIPVEFDAYWCPKCRKYFMGEGTYLNLKRRGYICCKVVEEKDLGTKKAGDGLYGNLASESILHMYGYTVNQQDDLSEAERQTIISFVIENRIQSAQDVAHLLEWLISQREGNPRMSVAVGRWRSDLRFVKRYHKPTRKVRVDRIYAKI